MRIQIMMRLFFHHRYELAQSGFFEPLLEAILPHLSGDEEKFIVDIGCGKAVICRGSLSA